ncbi:MAG: D-amino acid aminotransferase [Acidobacteriota bacterium]|nr:D-amino acid aminotransferase [Blastocatellia bacterium]MDW8238820.1 D-amino acid aminotransferase [Acidobacteriota bacterium]
MTQTEEHATSEGLVWLNGEFMDFASAKVSIDDRGFQFGDGVYEVVRVYDGRPFALEPHLARLRQSLREIELDIPLSDAELAETARELIRRSGLREAEYYLQITRGVARRYHLFPVGVPPTIVMTVRPVRPVPLEWRERGIAVKTFPDERWGRCDIKSINLLPNVLAKERAHRVGAQEALLVRQGIVTEGTSSNFFFFNEGALVTPLLGPHILPGVTRNLVLQLAQQHGLHTIERNATLDEFKAASEVFLSSTMMEMLAVVKIDDEPIGDGQPGPIFRQLYAAYQATVRSSE